MSAAAELAATVSSPDILRQARFARGLGEPPDPILTGNPKADDLIVEPHDMETYDALFDHQDPGHHDRPDDPDAPSSP